MRELTSTEQELVDHLVSFWRDRTTSLSPHFYYLLTSSGANFPSYSVLLQEVYDLQARFKYRDQFSSETAYRTSLELRARQVSGRQEWTNPRYASSDRSTKQIGTSNPLSTKTDVNTIALASHSATKTNDVVAAPSARPTERRASVPTLSQLCISVAETTRDYRAGDLGPMSPEHIERWVYQFDEGDRLTILQELDRILARAYISKAQAEKLTMSILTNTDLFGVSPADTIPTTAFLRVQRKGGSQRELLQMADNVLFANYGLHLPSPSEASQYIYLDDCLFSGNRAYRDILNWLPQAPANAKLRLVFWTGHSDGIAQVKKQLRLAPKTAHMDIEIRVVGRTFENEPERTETYDCLWPQASDDDAQIEWYVNTVKKRSESIGGRLRLFRGPHVPSRETWFSSPEARHVVERAFLKAGVYISSLPEDRNPYMRPMGNERQESLGFGAMFVTYRNISNNCPLALWWGDPSFPKSHPLGKWLPLFKRKTNEPTGAGQTAHVGHATVDSDDDGWASDEIPF